MRSPLPWIALAVSLALVAGALFAIHGETTAPFAVTASAVNFNLNYSHPASGVMELWTSNNSHVTYGNGSWVMGTNPGIVNVERVASYDDGLSVGLYLRVKTTIASQSNVTYEIRMYTRADNRTHYILDFSNGLASLSQNVTGTRTTNMTANVTIAPASTLNALVNKSLLGGVANITAWNIDASAKEVGNPYTYVDYVWQLPGNPGSAPAAIQGHVTDAANGHPLAGVNVSTSGFYTTTNASGYYLLPATYGNLTVAFSLSGYATVTKQVTVLVDHTATLDAQMGTATPPLSNTSWIVIVAVIVIAVAAIAAVMILRRKARQPPERPPQTP